MANLLLKSRNPQKEIFTNYQCCVDEVVANKVTSVHGGDGPHPNPQVNAVCILSTKYNGAVAGEAWAVNNPLKLSANGEVSVEGKDLDENGNQTDVSTNAALTAAVSAREEVCCIRLPRSSVVSAQATGWNVVCEVTNDASVAFDTNPYTTAIYVSKSPNTTNPADVIQTKFSEPQLFATKEFPKVQRKWAFTIQNTEIPAGTAQPFYLFTAYTMGPTGNATIQGGSYNINAVPSTSST